MRQKSPALNFDKVADPNYSKHFHQDTTVRLWNIENADQIPMVMERKKAIGLKVFKVRVALYTPIVNVHL